MVNKPEAPLGIPRLIITIATLVYGVIPLFVDISATHAFHPEWPPHARFHMVWLLGTNSTLAILALYLMWVSNLEAAVSIRLAGIIGLCVYGGFVISTVTSKLYGGALVDPIGGVPPVMGMESRDALGVCSGTRRGPWSAKRRQRRGGNAIQYGAKPPPAPPGTHPRARRMDPPKARRTGAAGGASR